MRLRLQVDASADPVLGELLNELSGYPMPGGNKYDRSADIDYAAVAVPFQFATEGGILSFLSTTTVFGTPVDITLSELALESFFPADAAWNEAKLQLKHCQKVLLKVVSEFVEHKLDRVEPGLNVTYHELIQGIIQHDAYHLGQAMIAMKLIAPGNRIAP